MDTYLIGEWYFFATTKSIRTLSVLFNISVPMKTNFERLPSPRYSFERPIQVNVDLYDSWKLPELPSLSQAVQMLGHHTPFPAHELCGTESCISCRRLQWEKTFQPISRELWNLLDELGPDPAFRQERLTIRPAILINLVLLQCSATKSCDIGLEMVTSWRERTSLRFYRSTGFT